MFESRPRDSEFDLELLCVVLKPRRTWGSDSDRNTVVPALFYGGGSAFYDGGERRLKTTVNGKDYLAQGQILLYRAEREPVELPFPSDEWRKRILEATLPPAERISKVHIKQVISELIDELRSADPRVAEMYSDLPPIKP